MNAGPGGYSIVATGYRSLLLFFTYATREWWAVVGWLFLGDPGAERHPKLCRAKHR